MSEIEDRRHRAWEAYHDATDLPEKFTQCGLADAIETATRVRITPEIIEAARVGYLGAGNGSWTQDPGPRQAARLKAAFEAAGFEVEE